MDNSGEIEPLKTTRTGWEREVFRREGRKARVRRFGKTTFDLMTERWLFSDNSSNLPVLRISISV